MHGAGTVILSDFRTSDLYSPLAGLTPPSYWDKFSRNGEIICPVHAMWAVENRIPEVVSGDYLKLTGRLDLAAGTTRACSRVGTFVPRSLASTRCIFSFASVWE